MKPIDQAVAEYLAAPENAKPKWSDLARKYLPEADKATQATINAFSDTIRVKARREQAKGVKVEVKPEPTPIDPFKLPFKRGQVYRYEEASSLLDKGLKQTRQLLDEAKAQGVNIVLKEDCFFLAQDINPGGSNELNLKPDANGWYTIGACGDNHLGSRYERLDVLNGLYDIFEQEGVKVVLNTGNYIDGEARFNKHDLNIHGMDRQLDYMIKQYPQREGITTYYVDGDDHEGWYVQREGVDIGALLEQRSIRAGRKDLVHLSYMEHDVVLPSADGKGQTVIRVQHPGGGSSYAISYTAQKIVESLSGNEKPDILLIGHYHKAEYLYTRGVNVIQTGTTMDQSPFMRKKRLSAHLGGWIIRFKVHPNGAIQRIQPEWIPFYDKAFYAGKKWAYQF